MDRPNILYLHSHDTGRYIQPYGFGLTSPAFQKLAEQGVLFRQHHCNAPTCSPSRATLLTGQCAHSSGMLGLAHRGHSLNDYSHHLLHTLREHGYYSVLVGVQHIAEDADIIGYDEQYHHPEPDKRYQAVANLAKQKLQERKDAGGPFFLSVGFVETHRPFPDVPEVAGNGLRPPLPLPDTPETRRDMAAYAEKLKQYDSGAGQVLDALDELGLADNTLVICTTDHGIAFPRMKCNLTDHGTGIMLIMRGPGEFTGGRTVDALTSHMDVFPTLCDYLDIDVPAWVEGTSFMPVIRNHKKEVNDEIYAEVTYHALYEPQRSVRTRRWKYIHRFEERTSPVLPNIDAGYAKDYLLEHGLRDRTPEQEQLYDLIYDPHEMHNLAGNADAAKVLKDMRSRLENWMERTDDPLRKGPVYVKGAMVTPPDGLDPKEKIRIL